MRMTPTERRLFKEKVIREYQIKHELHKKQHKSHYPKIVKNFKKLLPLNITLGLIACLLFVYLKGWDEFTKLLLSGIIWITLISTFISTFVKNK